MGKGRRNKVLKLTPAKVKYIIRAKSENISSKNHIDRDEAIIGIEESICLSPETVCDLLKYRLEILRTDIPRSLRFYIRVIANRTRNAMIQASFSVQDKFLKDSRCPEDIRSV